MLAVMRKADFQKLMHYLRKQDYKVVNKGVGYDVIDSADLVHIRALRHSKGAYHMIIHEHTNAIHEHIDAWSRSVMYGMGKSKATLPRN